jgi:signal transduction histidine kinase
MFDRRQVDVTVEIAPEIREVQVDPLHFEQALVSLITNAVQASQAGQRVRVIVESVPDSPTQWKISVVDEGAGIPPDIRHKIFLPYFTTKPDGNGIGLAMVSKVVKIHGGSLDVDSEVGRGSRFTAVLPGRVAES